MSWIITREKEGNTQLYMNTFRNDFSGEFRDPGGEGINLPLEFDMRFKALHRMYVQQEKDPSWKYEVQEYLR